MRLIDAVLADPRVAGCAHVELYCLPALIRDRDIRVAIARGAGVDPPG